MGKDDLTDKFNTPLNPAEEARFQAWARSTGRWRDVEDYDLRGAWKANAQEASNGHLPDTFKKPNHPTFSTESKYSGALGDPGGEWVDAGNGKWNFKASVGNVLNLSPQGLQSYFKTREPDAQLILPEPGDVMAWGVRRMFQKP